MKIGKVLYHAGIGSLFVLSLGCFFTNGEEDENNEFDNNPVSNNPVDNNPVDNNPVLNNPTPGDPVATCESSQDLSGTIDSATTLSPGPVTGCADYVVDGTLFVRAGLTIEPGTSLLFKNNASLVVDETGGFIKAIGTQAAPILFTSAQDINARTPGWWRGIAIRTNHPDNELTWVDVAYGGGERHSSLTWQNNERANLLVTNSGRLKVTNSIFRESANHGISLDQGTSLPVFENNRFEDNTLAPMTIHTTQMRYLDSASDYMGRSGHENGRRHVRVNALTLDDPNTHTWPALNVPYQLRGDTSVVTDVVVEAGAELRFEANASISVDEPNGSFAALGEEGAEIVMTSDQEPGGRTEGRWKGLRFQTHNSDNQLRYVDISYGGGERHSSLSFQNNNRANVLVLSDARLTIANSTIRNSENYGIAAESTANLTDFTANTFADNKEGTIYISAQRADRLDAESDYAAGAIDNRKFVKVYGQSIEELSPVIWNPLNVPFLFTGTTTVRSGVEILGGATLHFDTDAAIEVEGDGYLQVHGEDGNRVTFTSARSEASRAAGDWKGIIYRSNHANNEIQYADIHYGAGARHSSLSFQNNNRANVMVIDGGRAHLSNVELGHIRPGTSGPAHWGLACDTGANVTYEDLSSVGMDAERLLSPGCIAD